MPSCTLDSAPQGEKGSLDGTGAGEEGRRRQGEGGRKQKSVTVTAGYISSVTNSLNELQLSQQVCMFLC